ncbi:hypothetical protein BJ742DRAFT_770158 [Cladochytrium replicatum]|nr:hypothetical protein BJ742DRAFT_770158 [Cladochytrium replicatum]
MQIWEHPVVREMRGVRQTTQFTDLHAQMFQSNLIGLVVFAFCIVTGVSTSIFEALRFWKPLSTVWTYSRKQKTTIFITVYLFKSSNGAIMIILSLLFVINTIMTTRKWFAPLPRVDELALTLHQKRFLDLKGMENEQKQISLYQTAPAHRSRPVLSDHLSIPLWEGLRDRHYIPPSRIREGDDPPSFRSLNGSECQNMNSPSIGSLSPLGAYLSRTSPRGDDLIRDRRSLEK